MITDGYGAVVLFVAGWLACLLWTHRVAMGDWIEDLLDSVLRDPEPVRPIGPARSHVHLVGGDDDGGDVG